MSRLMIMAGGTGGHVFPALAVAQALQQQGHEVHWLGTAAGLESRVVPGAGLPLHTLTIGGLRGKGWRTRLMAPMTVLRAVWQARGLMQRLKIQGVVGFGGYVTGPGGVAARSLGLPLVIHEQNAIAGFTNRCLSWMATRVLLGFPGALRGNHVITTGNPVRQDITQIKSVAAHRASERPLRVLVVGGSLGAQALNEHLPSALAQLDPTERPEVRHQTGQAQAEATVQRYDRLGVHADVVPFIDDMAAALAWADVMVCRSGALTVAELAAVGLPAVLVPYPFAVDDHQTANARFLSDAGAAFLLPQTQLNATTLAQTLRRFQDPELRQSMAQRAQSLGRPQATADVVKHIIEVMS